MADASCSGGTPFKRLIDHQSRDVSHHQDRLVDRTGAQSHNSFRSTPQSAQGQNGFASFMDGPSTLPGMPHHHHAAGRLAAHAAALDPAHAPSFAPGRTQQFQAPSPPVADVTNWAADFSRFSQQQQPQSVQNGFHQPPAQMQMNQQQQIPQYNFQAAFGQPNAGFTPLYGPTNGGFMDANAAAAQRPAAEAEFDQEMSRWMASHGDGQGMEDVDAVMDQMARELELNEAKLAEAETATEQEAKTTTSETPLVESSHFTDLETPEIGNLTLSSDEPLVAENSEPPKVKSDVAEAAERLLESVQHEEGDKWKNSVFLQLMRDFRDGKKDIVNDDIRDTPENETPAPATAN